MWTMAGYRGERWHQNTRYYWRVWNVLGSRSLAEGWSRHAVLADAAVVASLEGIALRRGQHAGMRASRQPPQEVRDDG